MHHSILCSKTNNRDLYDAGRCSREPHRAANNAELGHPRILKGPICLKVLCTTQNDPDNCFNRPTESQRMGPWPENMWKTTYILASGIPAH